MVWNDFAQLFGAILVVVGAVLPVVNPPGDAPIFLRMTHGCDDATRSALARRIAVYSFGLLLGSLLFGSLVLRLFELSVAVIQVAGGAVVCSLGWKLLDDDPKPPEMTVDPRQASAAAMARILLPADDAADGRSRGDVGGGHRRRQPLAHARSGADPNPGRHHRRRHCCIVDPADIPLCGSVLPHASGTRA